MEERITNLKKNRRENMTTHNEMYAYDISSVKVGILLSGKNTGKGYMKIVC
jgi:hypothetical protein